LVWADGLPSDNIPERAKEYFKRAAQCKTFPAVPRHARLRDRFSAAAPGFPFWTQFRRLDAFPLANGFLRKPFALTPAAY
jgi:hypothetical protein